MQLVVPAAFRNAQGSFTLVHLFHQPVPKHIERHVEFARTSRINLQLMLMQFVQHIWFKRLTIPLKEGSVVHD